MEYPQYCGVLKLTTVPAKTCDLKPVGFPVPTTIPRQKTPTSFSSMRVYGEVTFNHKILLGSKPCS